MATTVGIDIGTTSVKAVAVDDDGQVLARSRVAHGLGIPAADRMEHDPDRAWRAGVRQALTEVASGHDVVGVNVSAMVPSLCAVNEAGHALTPGLLYGDARAGIPAGTDPSRSGELVGFLRWCSEEAPDAAGYWPAQAMANHALCGDAVIDTITAMTAVPLFDYAKWDEVIATEAGARVEQLPRIVGGGEAAGEVAEGPAAGAALGGGIVDAFAEQLVAGADGDGDVLVICGATLICWAVIPDWIEVDGLWTVPHSAEGKSLIGGPSNAGGLFVDFVRRFTGDRSPATDPGRVPVWTPYLRGERVPLHDPSRRGGLHDLDLTHGPAEVLRAAHEASAFVVRHQLDLAGLSPRRLVVTGGGTRSAPWMQAMADGTDVPVETVVVPEGGALGSAFAARVVVGLEESMGDARRWARTDRRIEPDPAWATAVRDRYERFRELTAHP